MADDLLSNELPPTYDEACSGATAPAIDNYPPKIQIFTSNGFCAVDIVPNKPFHRFPNLIEMANEWLKSNPQWQVKNCETIRYSSNVGTNADTSKVTFSSSDTFMRCLRLWLTPQTVSPPISVQINYFNEIPALLSASKSPPEFENFDVLMKKLNHRLRFQPIDGRVITVESASIPINVSKHQSDWINPDKIFFVDCDVQVVILRVFYVYGPTSSPNIVEIRDFTPRLLTTVLDRNTPQHETFADLVQQATIACRGTQICNIQTVPTKVVVGVTKVSVCCLRVVILIQSCPDSFSVFNTDLMSKTFLPIQIGPKINVENWNEPPKFESVQMTLKRINQWANENNVKLISAETCVMQMYPRIHDENGPQSTNIYRSTDKNHIWIVRAYVDGIYPDPVLEMCPVAFQGWSNTNKRFLETKVVPAGSADANCDIM